MQRCAPSQAARTSRSSSPRRVSTRPTPLPSRRRHSSSPRSRNGVPSSRPPAPSRVDARPAPSRAPARQVPWKGIDMDGETSPGGLFALWRRHPLRVHIATVFLVLLLVACSVIAWTNYDQGRRIVFSSAEDLFEQIERRGAGDIERLRAPVATVVDLLSRGPLMEAESFRARMQQVDRLAEVLIRHESLSAVYVGYFNGDFFLLRPLRDEETKKTFLAPRHAAFLVQSIERRGGAPRGRLVLLDSALNTISEATPADYNFDPRSRPWYRAALKDTELVQTDPYVFFTIRVAGETLARRAEHGRAVVGADLTLERISSALARSRATPSTQLAIFDPKGNVIAYSDPRGLVTSAAGGALALARISELSPVMAMTVSTDPGTLRTIEVEGRRWLVKTAQIGLGNSLASAVPLDELLTEANATLRRSLWLTLLIVLLSAPLTWWIAHRIAANLDALTAFAAAIRLFRFDAPLKVQTRIVEIADLGSAMRQMRDTIRQFLDISMALSAEHNFDRLLQRVLEEALEAAGGSGGVIYLLEEDGRTLKPAAQVWSDGNAVALDAFPWCGQTTRATRWPRQPAPDRRRARARCRQARCAGSSTSTRASGRPGPGWS